ncbi:CLUMA_CG014673, isoform A [Clunio marinus]|uniref:CLUMA_CG014673, isoform A n=1 Tax=Clunio marinus TaxID=568069 RepID=A0A1J1IMF7_9DIPT|nr:CLUMA_CG014673, isoform A [Clunio marinus]
MSIFFNNHYDHYNREKIFKVPIIIGCTGLCLAFSYLTVGFLFQGLNRECCRVPDYVTGKIINKIHYELVKAPAMATYLKACKLFEGVFRKLNLLNGKEIDQEAARKLFDIQLKDPEWKYLFSRALKSCLDDVNSQLDDDFIEVAAKDDDKTDEKSISTLRKDFCDNRYTATVECLRVISYMSCKHIDWDKNPTCHKAKEFLENCEHDAEAMNRFFGFQRYLY